MENYNVYYRWIGPGIIFMSIPDVFDTVFLFDEFESAFDELHEKLVEFLGTEEFNLQIFKYGKSAICHKCQSNLY